MQTKHAENARRGTQSTLAPYYSAECCIGPYYSMECWRQKYQSQVSHSATSPCTWSLSRHSVAKDEDPACSYIPMTRHVCILETSQAGQLPYAFETNTFYARARRVSMGPWSNSRVAHSRRVSWEHTGLACMRPWL